MVDSGQTKMSDVIRMESERSQQEVSDRLRFQVEFAQSVLKNLTLVNGGAIVALFTFIGHDGNRFNMDFLWLSFASFSIGITFSLSAFFGAFYSQLFFMNAAAYEMWNAQLAMVGKDQEHDVMIEFKKGNYALIAGVLLAIFSLIAFIIGSACALGGVQ